MLLHSGNYVDWRRRKHVDSSQRTIPACCEPSPQTRRLRGGYASQTVPQVPKISFLFQYLIPSKMSRERAHILDVLLHLLIGQPAKLGLEIAEVVDRSPTVGGSNNIRCRLPNFVGYRSPSCFYGRDGVDEGCQGVKEGGEHAEL